MNLVDGTLSNNNFYCSVFGLFSTALPSNSYDDKPYSLKSITKDISLSATKNKKKHIGIIFLLGIPIMK